jgi:hypothetical protein
MIRFRSGLAAYSSPLITSRRLMVTLPVSPVIVIQGPSGLQFRVVWGFFGMARTANLIRCRRARAHPYSP